MVPGGLSIRMFPITRSHVLYDNITKKLTTCWGKGGLFDDLAAPLRAPLARMHPHKPLHNKRAHWRAAGLCGRSGGDQALQIHQQR